MSTKSCPSCGNAVGVAQACCGNCGWQFSSPTICATRPTAIAGRGQTLARGVTRPKWMCSNTYQLAVLVRDASISMSGRKAKDASAASLDLVKVLADPTNKDGFYAAVVDFSGNAKVVHPATKATELSGNMSELDTSIFGGCTNITDGLNHAVDIVREFTAPDGREPLRPVVVLFSDGGHNEGPQPDSVAAALKDEADLICIAFGSNADEADLQRWASSNMFTRCSSGADLRRFFSVVGATMQATRARGVNATQALANLQV